MLPHTFDRIILFNAEEEEDISESSTPEYDHAKCQELASHLGHLKSLPAPCLKYKDVTTDLKRRDTDTTHPTQFLG
jgi:hypothetical protein